MNIELDLPQPRASVWLWLISMLIPAIVVGTLLLIDTGDAPMHLVLVLALVPVAAIVLLLHITMHRQRAWIEGGALHVVSTFYRRRIPLDRLDLDGARVLDLHEHREWRPWLRTNGFALPGMVSGNYRLPKWRKAFAAFGDGHRVLCMDAGDFRLLLGAAHPQSALDKLRRARAREQAR